MTKINVRNFLRFFLFIFSLYQVDCLSYENSYKVFKNYVHLGFELNLLENITKPTISNKFFCLHHCSKRNECKIVIESEYNCFLLNVCFDFNKISNQNKTTVYVKNSYCIENSNGMYIPTSINITNKKSLVYSSIPWSLVLLPNGYLASGYQDSTILIWDLNNATKIKYLNDHLLTVNFLVVNKNGELVSGSHDGNINIWDSNYASKRLTISGPLFLKVSSLAVLENGDLVCSFSENKIRIFDVNNGTEKALLIDGLNKVNSIIVLDNSLIASGNEGGTVIIWNLKNNSIHKKFGNIAAPIDILATLNKRDIAIGGMETKIRILNIIEGKLVKNLTRFTGNRVNSLAFLPNGDLISCFDDFKIIIWNTIDGIIIKELTGIIFGKVVSLAVLNCSFFASGSLDTQLIIWG